VDGISKREVRRWTTRHLVPGGGGGKTRLGEEEPGGDGMWGGFVGAFE
jgi:hypothetical protein